MSTVTVLVVDDAPHWRKFIGFLLRIDSGIEIVCEAANAAEAVKTTAAHRPAVVLLDIALPDVCGLEVGQEILRHFPETRIIFVSQESDIDVVHRAFSVGAVGYVLKLDAGSDLLMAIHRATQEQRYLSRSLPPSANITH